MGKSQNKKTRPGETKRRQCLRQIKQRKGKNKRDQHKSQNLMKEKFLLTLTNQSNR